MTSTERAAIYLTGAKIDVREEPPKRQRRRGGKKPKTAEPKVEPDIDLTAGGVIDST